MNDPDILSLLRADEPRIEKTEMKKPIGLIPATPDFYSAMIDGKSPVNSTSDIAVFRVGDDDMGREPRTDFLAFAGTGESETCAESAKEDYYSETYSLPEGAADYGCDIGDGTVLPFVGVSGGTDNRSGRAASGRAPGHGPFTRRPLRRNRSVGI